MPVLAEAVVEISTDLKPLDKGLSGAKAKLSDFAGQGKAALAGFAGGAGALLAAKGVEEFTAALGSALGMIKSATVNATNLGETMSKVKTVFGDSARVIIGTSDMLAEKFGVVKQQSLDAAANIGLIGQGAGMTAKESAVLGSRMAALAVDAASFFNTEIPVALEKIRAGLTGESEPLKAFGVLLSEDAVKAQAFKMGLKGASGELTESAKVAARTALIIKGLALANGDAERTADSAANKMKKFAGDLENLKTQLGQSLIGPLSESLALANDLGKALGKAFNVESVGSLGEQIQQVIAGVRVLLGFVDAKGIAADPKEMEAVKAKARAKEAADLAAAPTSTLSGADAYAEWSAKAKKEGSLLGSKKPGDFMADAKSLASGAAKLVGALPTILSATTGGGDSMRSTKRPTDGSVTGGKVVEEGTRAKSILGGPAGLLVDLVKGIANAPGQKRIGESSITSGEDFRAMAQTNIMNSVTDIPHQQLDAAKQALGKLDAIGTVLTNILQKDGPVQAIMRGRS